MEEERGREGWVRGMFERRRRRGERKRSQKGIRDASNRPHRRSTIFSASCFARTSNEHFPEFLALCCAETTIRCRSRNHATGLDTLFAPPQARRRCITVKHNMTTWTNSLTIATTLSSPPGTSASSSSCTTTSPLPAATCGRPTSPWSLTRTSVPRWRRTRASPVRDPRLQVLSPRVEIVEAHWCVAGEEKKSPRL